MKTQWCVCGGGETWSRHQPEEGSVIGGRKEEESPGVESYFLKVWLQREERGDAVAVMGKEAIKGGLFLSQRDITAHLNTDRILLPEICPTETLPTCRWSRHVQEDSHCV